MRVLRKTCLALGFSLVLAGCLSGEWSPLGPQGQRGELVEFQLVRITSDASELVYLLNGAVDEAGALRELRYHAPSQDYRMELTNLAEGRVLFEYRGRTIATIYSNDFTPDSGGRISMDYLQNGITGYYERFKFELKRNGNDWELYTTGPRSRKFTELYMETNRFLGQIIGIDSITPRAR